MASRRVVDFGAPAQLRQDARARLDARRSVRGGALVRAARVGRCCRRPRRSLELVLARPPRRHGCGHRCRCGTGPSSLARPAIYRQFPGFNEVTGIRGTPDLVPERAMARRRRPVAADWHVDARAGGLVLPPRPRRHRAARDDWQIVDGDLTPPRVDTRYVNALTSRATGIELLLQRRSPNSLSGWLTYSYGAGREENRLTGERYDAEFRSAPRAGGLRAVPPVRAHRDRGKVPDVHELSDRRICRGAGRHRACRSPTMRLRVTSSPIERTSLDYPPTPASICARRGRSSSPEAG